MAEYIKVIRGFLKRLNQDHVGAFAAQAAYFILLSFVPFVILLITLVRHIPLVSESNVTRFFLQIVPDSSDLQVFVLQIIREIFGKSTAVVPAYQWGQCHLSCKRDQKLCDDADPLRILYVDFYSGGYRKPAASGIRKQYSKTSGKIYSDDWTNRRLYNRHADGDFSGGAVCGISFDL